MMVRFAGALTRLSAGAGALALAAFAAFAVPAGAAEDADFTCKPPLLGLCRMEYSGPRDAGAALDYLAEAEAATQAALEAHPDVEAMHYRPGKGTLTVIPLAGRTVPVLELQQLAEHFLRPRLRLERVFAPGAAVAPGRDRGGRSRFNALSEHIVAASGRQARAGAVEMVSSR